MFELKIKLDNSLKKEINIINQLSEIVNDPDSTEGQYIEKKDSNLFETVSGCLQIMRVKSENISLTDKYEFFRFLPIKRGEIVNIIIKIINLDFNPSNT